MNINVRMALKHRFSVVLQLLSEEKWVSERRSCYAKEWSILRRFLALSSYLLSCTHGSSRTQYTFMWLYHLVFDFTHRRKMKVENQDLILKILLGSTGPTLDRSGLQWITQKGKTSGLQLPLYMHCSRDLLLCLLHTQTLCCYSESVYDFPFADCFDISAHFGRINLIPCHCWYLIGVRWGCIQYRYEWYHQLVDEKIAETVILHRQIQRNYWLG